MPTPLSALVALALALRLVSCSEPEFVTQEERSEAGDLYYTYHHSYITSNSPHYLVRVSEATGDVDTLYTSENFFSFDLSDGMVEVTTCRAEAGFERVTVTEEEDYNCTTNRPVLDKRKR